MPSIAIANNMELSPIPPELFELNMLEKQLIAKILPFAKIISLPKGQQKAVHGAVVCTPSEVQAAVNALPRPNNEAQLLQVKLKRNIKYKGYQHFFTVNMNNVLAALAISKEIHCEYKDITINHNAQFELVTEDQGRCDEEQDAEPQRADEKEQEEPEARTAPGHLHAAGRHQSKHSELWWRNL